MFVHGTHTHTYIYTNIHTHICVCCVLSCFSRVQLCATPWTVAHQAPLSMGFSRQEYWSGFSYSSPGDLPDPGFKRGSPVLQAKSLLSETLRNPDTTCNDEF